MEFISQWEESGTYKQNVYDSSGIDMIYEEKQSMVRITEILDVVISLYCWLAREYLSEEVTFERN
jgi:hypothetical protein